MTEVAVYRLFDASGALLYVGHTERIRARFALHKHRSAWWGDVAAVDISIHERRVGQRIELMTILHDAPLHNRAWNRRRGWDYDTRDRGRLRYFPERDEFRVAA